jgi:hypothetical protein
MKSLKPTQSLQINRRSFDVFVFSVGLLPLRGGLRKVTMNGQ